MKDPIVQDGAAVLRGKAKPVAKKDIGSPALTKLLKRMSTILKKEPYGVALAAPQVGEPLRLFVVSGRVFTDDDADADAPTPADKVFINPTLTRLSRKKVEMQEGCLSVRGKYGTVLRHEKASIKAVDEHGKPFVYQGSGLVGHIFQHECDHLDGILYIDKAVHLRDDTKDEDPA